MEAVREGTPQNVSFDTPFQTGERVLSVKMNFFVDREEIFSGNYAHCCSEEHKMAWVRETRIRTFMQLELKACVAKINWMIRCHNCDALNCPQKEYLSRLLPIPPDYIDNLQSRLIKVKKGMLPLTLKIILKTYYHPPARQARITSPTVQPDDTMLSYQVLKATRIIL